jgi:3-hydroxyisobutyrate dehydrogenase-like beta-hydroxyacid dehydrogenase
MARHILDAGHTLTVHDLRRDAATNLLESGAHWADSPAGSAAGQDVVMTCLPMPRDVEAACCGEDGIAEGIKPGTVVIDCSTNSVAMVKRQYDTESI